MPWLMLTTLRSEIVSHGRAPRYTLTPFFTNPNASKITADASTHATVLAHKFGINLTGATRNEKESAGFFSVGVGVGGCGWVGGGWVGCCWELFVFDVLGGCSEVIECSAIGSFVLVVCGVVLGHRMSGCFVCVGMVRSICHIRVACWK